MSGRLAEKVCVITGTGGSMGRATALAFAREGAMVVGCDVAVEPAETTLSLVSGAGGEMVSLQPCVVSDPTDCAALVDLAIETFGRIDVLFNLAGRSHFGLVEAVTDEDWDAARRDEVDVIFYPTRAAWPHLVASKGVVVNMASLNGQLSFKSLASLSHTTNKAAIIGMTVGFANSVTRRLRIRGGAAEQFAPVDRRDRACGTGQGRRRGGGRRAEVERTVSSVPVLMPDVDA